jgi:hypothetical protein
MLRETTGALWAALLVAGSGAQALPIVTYSVDELGGGLFQYNLTVNNDGGGEALAGLNVLYAGSVFGLDGSSTIGAPGDWAWFAPLPPLIDDLNYFSLSPAGDVAIGGTLGGFSFQSSTDPDTLAGEDFAVEGIGADSATQINLGVAQLVPEPALVLLLGGGGTGVWARRRRQGAR